MNRTCNYKDYESNCRPIRINSLDSYNESCSEGTDALELFGKLICKLVSGMTSAAFRVFMAVACIIGFIGIIGGIEAETISVATGVVSCALMIFIEILCFATSKRK